MTEAARRGDDEIRADLHSVNAYEARLINAPRACNRLLDDVEPLLAEVATLSARVEELERSNVGRCGEKSPDLKLIGMDSICSLPHGHAGWHRDSATGCEWNQPAERDAAQARADEAEADRDSAVTHGRDLWLEVNSWRTRAERAEAQVRAVEALPALWEARAAIGEAHDSRAVQFRTAATELRAALAASPSPVAGQEAGT